MVLAKCIKDTDSIRKSHQVIPFIVPYTVPMSFSGDDTYGATQLGSRINLLSGVI